MVQYLLFCTKRILLKFLFVTSLFAGEPNVDMSSEKKSFNLHQTGVTLSTEKGKKRSHPSETHLTWHNLTVSSVPPHSPGSCCKSDQIPNVILDNVSGVARPGDFVAILGASGSGKTTLLNALASRLSKKLELSGDVKFNGSTILQDKIKDMSGYVGQDDTFFASMTVCEVIFFYANLKLDPRIPRTEKEVMALEALQKVGLSKIKNSFVGDIDRPGISGGEKKRLAVATQLIFGASLLFLDEVTSGLDSLMAESIIKIMKDLAESGCTILCTVHQPSSVLYDMFDKVCLISEGKIAFFGSHIDALIHFEESGYPCSPYHCPADHFIYTLAIKSDDEVKCRERCAEIVQSYERSSFHTKVNNDIESTSIAFKTTYGDYEGTKLKVKFWDQLSENFRRGLRDGIRNPRLARARCLVCVFMSLIVGFVYFGTDNDIASVSTTKSGIFLICVLIFGRQSMQLCALTITLDINIIKRDYQNGLYTTLPYFISVVLLELLVLVPYVFLAVTIFYFLAGLKIGAGAFLTACACLFITCFTSSAIGWFIGVVVEDPTLVGVIYRGSLPLLAVGLFKYIKDTDYFLLPIKYLCWLRYSFNTFMINEFKDLELDCGDEECPYNGTTILLDMGIHPNDLWWPNMACNTGIGVGFAVMASLLLAYKTAR